VKTCNPQTRLEHMTATSFSEISKNSFGNLLRLAFCCSLSEPQANHNAFIVLNLSTMIFDGSATLLSLLSSYTFVKTFACFCFTKSPPWKVLARPMNRLINHWHPKSYHPKITLRFAAISRLQAIGLRTTCFSCAAYAGK
jgi:hypothetical protein